MAEPDRAYRLAPDVAWVDIDDRVVVVRLSEPAADPLVLADSAAEVWRAVGDGATTVEIVASVAEVYGMETTEVEAGVTELVVNAVSLGILTTS